MKHQLWSKKKDGGSRKVKFLSLLLVVTFGLCCIVACGGDSGGSSSVSALTLPNRVELTQVDDGGSGASLSGAISRAYSDTGTDYSSQTVDTWVDDTDALDMVNDILGVCQETGYQNFVNQGAYKALVNKVGESDTSQSGSSSSSTTTESLQEITIDVTRASNTAPMIIKIWVEESDGPGGMPMIIRGYFEVTESVSAQYPYGVMEAHFKGNVLNNDGSEGDQLFTMAMSVSAEGGNVVVEFVESCYEEAHEYERDNRVRVVADSTVTTGNAYVYEKEVCGLDTDESTSYFAFNENYFKYTDDGGATETVLDKNDFSYKIYRYKLFDADGATVTRTSGFPIQLVGGENSGQHAYIGYWGLWAPYGVEINNGDTVTRMGSDAEYTVVKVRGKLRVHTKAEILLGDLDGVEMSYWTDTGDSIIAWTTSQVFQKLGSRSMEDGQITYLETPEDLAGFNDWEGAWCEALKAYLPLGRLYKNDAGESITPDNTSTVNYHEEETVSPATALDMTLYCWQYVLDAPIDQSVIDAADEGTYWGDGAIKKTYFFDASELVLKEDNASGEAVIIPAGLDLSASNYQWGLHVSPLTEAPYTVDDWWKAHDADTYYSWETGDNDWNQFATLIDSSGDYVTFQAPLMLSYTHSTANDINDDAAHNDKKFKMDYDGFELHIPWEFNPDAAEDHKWEPMFNLKDGVVLTGSDATEYVVKGIERAMVMNEASNPSLADDLTVVTTIPAPTLVYDASKTALVGARPTDVEVKVSKGEVL